MPRSGIDLNPLDAIPSKDFYEDNLREWQAKYLPNHNLMLDRHYLGADNRFMLEGAESWFVLRRANVHLRRVGPNWVFIRQDVSKRAYVIVRLTGVTAIRVPDQPVKETLLLMWAE